MARPTLTVLFLSVVGLVLNSANAVAVTPGTELFDESLTLRPLPDGKVAASFTFSTLLAGATPRDPATLHGDDTPQHYTLFPLALGQVLREYAIAELHLTLNAGRWNYDRWGYPDDGGGTWGGYGYGVSTGAELWAWMGDGGPASIDERWTGLRNALSGLFCASLASMDAQRTSSPALTFAPTGALPLYPSSSNHSDAGAAYRLRHATLPSENVCTENLTPFLKLLPCTARAGIAQLLNPHRLFDADWHGMGVHVSWDDGAHGGTGGVRVRLAFQTVFDPVRTSDDRRRDWSFRTLLDRTIDRACPVANSSLVHVTLPTDAYYHVSPEPSSTQMRAGHGTYDVHTSSYPLDVSLHYVAESSFSYPLSDPPPPTDFSAARTLTNPSQTHGTLIIDLTNHRDTPLSVRYTETMPWLVTFYLHTLHTTLATPSGDIIRDDLVTIESYQPSLVAGRPTLLQAAVMVPAHATIRLRMDVAKSFLKYTAHMPDAQRGWDLPGAVFVPLSPGNSTLASADVSTPRIYVHTRTLLVDIATPDFSMPYNVIIMSCTLIALIFGSIFNILTRRFVVVDLTLTPGSTPPADTHKKGPTSTTININGDGGARQGAGGASDTDPGARLRATARTNGPEGPR